MISTTPRTAISPDDYVPIAANTQVSFGLGSDAEVYPIDLESDPLVEGIEYFQVSIATVDGTNAVDGSIDTDLDTANVFILDLSCKLKGLFL